MKVFTKILSVCFILTAFASHGASADEAFKLPDTLYCNGMKCLKGKRDFCDLNEFASIELSQLNSKTSVHWADNDSGVLRFDENKGKVILDFGMGPHEDDQYTTFSFSKRALRDLAREDAVQISGFYEEGYDWGYGYHVRALVLLRCHK